MWRGICFINTTPHKVNIKTKEGEMISIESDMTIRLSEIIKGEAVVEGLALISVDYSRPTEEEISYLCSLVEKAPVEKIFIIVSGLFTEEIAKELVREIRSRTGKSVNIVAPYTGTALKYRPERNEKGQIVYVKALRVLA